MRVEDHVIYLKKLSQSIKKKRAGMGSFLKSLNETRKTKFSF
ncbi:hypothetical protein BDW_03730 [Bdellovibrio bacteriovorus W]|nr:hypothetical protein BDW_03730 [Bdellovibrio bacteriovorus W]